MPGDVGSQPYYKCWDPHSTEPSQVPTPSLHLSLVCADCRCPLWRSHYKVRQKHGEPKSRLESWNCKVSNSDKYFQHCEFLCAKVICVMSSASFVEDVKSCSICHRKCSDCSTVLLLSISFLSCRAFGISGSKYSWAPRTASRPMLNSGWQGFCRHAQNTHTTPLHQMSLSHKTLMQKVTRNQQVHITPLVNKLTTQSQTMQQPSDIYVATCKVNQKIVSYWLSTGQVHLTLKNEISPCIMAAASLVLAMHNYSQLLTFSTWQCDSVAQWLRHWIRDQEVMGSTPDHDDVGQQP